MSREIPLNFSDKLGNVYQSDRGLVISTSRGSRAFSTLNKTIDFSGMKHTEGGYVRNDFPNGRYRITYQILKKDENSPDTIYLCTGGNPEAIAISTNIELNTEYEYEFEVRERFLSIVAMDSYDKNGTTEIELLKLEELEVFEEDLPQTLSDNSPIIFEGSLEYIQRFVGYFSIHEVGEYKLHFETFKIPSAFINEFPLGNDLLVEVKKYRSGNTYYYDDIKIKGTYAGTYVKPLLPDEYILTVSINNYQSKYLQFKATISLNQELVIEEIDGKYYKVYDGGYILIKF